MIETKEGIIIEHLAKAEWPKELSQELIFIHHITTKGIPEHLRVMVATLPYTSPKPCEKWRICEEIIEEIRSCCATERVPSPAYMLLLLLLLLLLSPLLLLLWSLLLLLITSLLLLFLFFFLLSSLLPFLFCRLDRLSIQILCWYVIYVQSIVSILLGLSIENNAILFISSALLLINIVSRCSNLLLCLILW